MFALRDQTKNIVKSFSGALKKFTKSSPNGSLSTPAVTNVPWFDQPSAQNYISKAHSEGRISTEELPLFEKWVSDGYVVIDGSYSEQDIDSMIESLDAIWYAEKPIDGLTILGLQDDQTGIARSMTHAELLDLELGKRLKLREISDWRIHGFQEQNLAAKSIFNNEKIRLTISKLFGFPAHPIASINFMSGSQQALHEDMAVFHIYPHNYLIGAWIACEDVLAEAGPLVFYPGSHKRPLFSGFTDYPQTNLRTASQDLIKHYQHHVNLEAERHEKKTFLAKKGQVLFWHGMLIHGGDPIVTRGLSRKSMVVHYSVEGVNKFSEIKGPFNW